MIADIVQRLLRDRSIDREFAFEDNLRDLGPTSLDMTSLVFAVEADSSIQIPDACLARRRAANGPTSQALYGDQAAWLSGGGRVDRLPEQQWRS
jgi:acyl carrier protein